MWPFKSKQKADMLNKLVYKSGEEFFAMQCKYGHTEIKEGVGIVAIVLDSREMFGTKLAISTDEDGKQMASIRIAAQDGGFLTVSRTASSKGDELKPGDLVVWVPGLYRPELAQKFNDSRSGWVGLIMARIAPETNTSDNSLNVICYY